MVIQTKGTRITQMALRWETDCTSGYRFVFKGVFKYAGPMPKGNGVPGGQFVVGQSKLFANPIAKTGKFTAELFGSIDVGSTDVLANETTKITGTLKKTKGTGSYTAQTVISPVFVGSTPPSDFTPDVCDAGTWKWSVQRGPAIFGGSSQQGDPVVVRYDAKKHKVTDFAFGWRADGCQGPGTWWDFPDVYGNFPVSAAGNFGDDFVNAQPGPGGATLNWTYHIEGKVKGKRASGMFWVMPMPVDESGNSVPPAACSTPNITWSAMSG